MNEQPQPFQEIPRSPQETVASKIDTLKKQLEDLANSCSAIKESVSKALLELNQNNPEAQKKNALNSIKSLLNLAQQHYSLGPETFASINSVVNKLGILNNINLKEQSSIEKRERVANIFSDMKTYKPILVEFRVEGGQMKINISDPSSPNPRGEPQPYPGTKWNSITDFEVLNIFQGLNFDTLSQIQSQIDQQKAENQANKPKTATAQQQEPQSDQKEKTENKEEYRSVDITNMKVGAKVNVSVVIDGKISKASFTLQEENGEKVLKDTNGNFFKVEDINPNNQNLTKNLITEGNNFRLTSVTGGQPYVYKVYDVEVF